MTDNLIETFKIINGISNYSKQFFTDISPRIGDLLLAQISKPKSINQFDLFADRLIYFGDKLPNQIKKEKKLRLNTYGSFQK